jgi:hypothetical protein
MAANGEWSEGGCHCGGVRFRVRLVDGFTTIRRCTCSYCRMRGAVAVSAVLDDLEIVSGGDLLTEYRFHTGTARHWFCSRCGIYTHHQRRSDPSLFGLNVACLDGVSPFDFTEVPVNDGIAHPADHPGGTRRAGVLRYEPAADNV